MANDDDAYFQEELLRRSAQIAELRDELAAVKDRIDEAVERTGFLQQSKARLEAELSIRKTKANELEDRVALEQTQGEETSRGLVATASANVAEVARLRQAMAELDQAYVRAQADADEARRLLAEKESEVAAARIVLDAKSRETEFERDELAQQEVAEEEQYVQMVSQTRERGAAQIKDLDMAVSDALVARSEVSQLEKVLQTERECREGLERALQHTIEQNKQLSDDCVALRRELENLEAQEEEEELIDKLAASRVQCQHLAQDVANAKRHSLLQTQSIQGALEETQRMMNEHINQTRLHLDLTQQRPNDSSLGVLMTALAEARIRTASGIATRQHLERERSALEAEVKHAEEAIMSERDQATREQLARTDEELHGARQELEAASRRAGMAAEDLRKAEAAVALTERSEQQQEALLRAKLEELWHTIRVYKPSGRDVDSFAAPEHFRTGRLSTFDSPTHKMSGPTMRSTSSPYASFIPPPRTSNWGC